jgi:hypothetical protein
MQLKRMILKSGIKTGNSCGLKVDFPTYTKQLFISNFISTEFQESQKYTRQVIRLEFEYDDTLVWNRIFLERISGEW